MKEILILNGAARQNGNTKKLVDAFVRGAEGVGNHITEFYLQDMEIGGCRGCGACSKSNLSPNNPCIQNDDMTKIYSAFAKADVVVFASPVYFWSITGTLKIVADRLYAELRCLGYSTFPREGILIMTAGGSDYSQAVSWYRHYSTNLGWKNLGEVLGANKISQAEKLGSSIK